MRDSYQGLAGPRGTLVGPQGHLWSLLGLPEATVPSLVGYNHSASQTGQKMPVKRGNRKRKASAAGIAVAAKPALLPKAKKAKKDRYKRQARESVGDFLF